MSNLFRQGNTCGSFTAIRPIFSTFDWEDAYHTCLPQFPYALQALPNVLATQWDTKAFREYREAFPKEYQKSPKEFQAHVEDLTSRDVKVAYLKNLQGFLWEQGYQTGEKIEWRHSGLQAFSSLPNVKDLC